MGKNPNKQLKKILALLSKKGGSVYEDDLITKFNLDKTWYCNTFKVNGSELIKTNQNGENNRHFVTLTPTGISLSRSLTKPWYEGFLGHIFFIVIGAIVAIILEKYWDKVIQYLKFFSI
jgi:hypothetical protein